MKQIERLIESLQEKYRVDVSHFIELYASGTSTEVIAITLETTEWTIRVLASTLNLRLPKKYRPNDHSLLLGRFEEVSEGIVESKLAIVEEDLERAYAEIVGKEKQLATTRRQLQKYKQVATSPLEDYQDFVAEAISHIDTIGTSYPVYLPTPSGAGRELFTQFMVLSDLHVEESVTTDDVGLANSFTWGIAMGRLAEVFRGVRESHRGETTLIVMMLGDMISGIIHDTLEHTTKPTAQALTELATELSQHLKSLASMYSHIYVPCLSGNHGRISDNKKSTANGYNFEYLMYNILQALVADTTSIEVNISTNGFQVLNIGGKIIGMHHGDFFRMPSGDMTFLRIKEAFLQATGESPDHLISGHTHKPETKIMPRGGYAIVNGSLIGVNGYSHTNGFVGIDWSQTIGAFSPNGEIDYTKLIM